MPAVNRVNDLQGKRSQPKLAKTEVNTSENNVARFAAPSAAITQVTPGKELRVRGRTATQRADRNARDARRLAAVSGVVISSKVPVGHLPDQGRWQKEERKIHPCSICARKFALKAHVKVHMVACVGRNGNPNGVRWDDAWRNGASQAAPTNGQSNDQDFDMEESESEDAQSDDQRPYDYRPEDHELSDLSHGGFQRDHSLIDIDFRDNTRPASHLSPGLKHHNPADFIFNSQLPSPTESDGQSLPSSPTDLVPYDPNLRMDVLTNEALLCMVQAWQFVTRDEANVHSLRYPHYRRVMEELWIRCIVDENGNWIVDVERLNMFFRRVVW